MRKDKIFSCLLHISSFDTKTDLPISGLLFENITLGTKRKLQKIQKELMGFYAEYQEHLKEATEKGPEEVAILNAEEVTLTSETVSMAMIEAIQTDKNYDFDIIELFAK